MEEIINTQEKLLGLKDGLAQLLEKRRAAGGSGAS